MILLMILLGIVLAFSIARYNQSNKLFWILFTSFVIGIAGGSVLTKVTKSHSHSKEYVDQLHPTQVLYNTLGTIPVTNDVATTAVNPVSKDNVVGLINITPAISKCEAKPRTKPPITLNAITCTDISTHLDGIPSSAELSTHYRQS